MGTDRGGGGWSPTLNTHIRFRKVLYNSGAGSQFPRADKPSPRTTRLMSIVGAGPGASLRAPASAAGDVLADAASVVDGVVCAPLVLVLGILSDLPAV